VLVINRFVVSDGDEAEFSERARTALGVLAERPGYVSGALARAWDDPTQWVLSTEWASVGAYRRALGGFEVKVHATPLLAQSLDEPSAYEVLVRTDETGAVTSFESDRAPGAGDALRSRP
jgi:heme oxygenase (mycobilin-producing)